MSLFFKPVDNFSTVNPYIKMEWNGFAIPEAAMFPELVLFKVKTFTAFTRDTSGLGMTFNPVNEFLSTLSIQEQQTIASAFLTMHVEINDPHYTVEYIEELEDELGNMLNKLDDAIDLCDRINNYIRHSNIPISDMAEAGTRPQDSPEMTFGKEEAITITTIAILMKLLCPVIGAFADRYNRIIDTKYKECHEHAIMTPLFRKKYSDIICKLTNYIKTLIAAKLKADPTASINGNTIDAMTNTNLDTIIIKRFVNVDLYRPDGNVIKYIASCCRSGADSQQQNASMSNSYRIITDPVEMDKDEGNASRMESESKQSIRTADVPVMIRVAAKDTVKKVIAEYNLDRDLVESTLAYYRKNKIVMNPISIYLLCTYYGQDIGGGSGILMLNADRVSELAAILQIIYAQRHGGDIIHALTFNIGSIDKTQTFEHTAFLNGWKSSQAYGECKRMIPAGFGEREWDLKLREIASFLTRKNCILNTAPAIWDLMGQPSSNGKEFTNYMGLMIEIMQFIQVAYSSRQLQ